MRNAFYPLDHTGPPEKYEFVSWDDYKIRVPNHQPEMVVEAFEVFSECQSRMKEVGALKETYHTAVWKFTRQSLEVEGCRTIPAQTETAPFLRDSQCMIMYVPSLMGGQWGRCNLPSMCILELYIHYQLVVSTHVSFSRWSLRPSFHDSFHDTSLLTARSAPEQQRQCRSTATAAWIARRGPGTVLIVRVTWRTAV